MLCNVMQY